MTHKRLRAVMDDEFGILGLKFIEPRKTCNGKFTITDGLTLAHDIIEHQQGTSKIGTIGDEMVALGGVCYSRAQWSDMSRDRNYTHKDEEGLANDIMYMASLYFYNKIPFRQKLITSRKDDPTDYVDYVIEAARENWSSHFDHQHDIRKISQQDIDTYLETCRIYMLHGAKLADRRFGSGMLANQMFWEIERVTSDLIKDIQYEGQEFLLSYDFNRKVSFREYEDKLYY